MAELKVNEHGLLFCPTARQWVILAVCERYQGHIKDFKSGPCQYYQGLSAEFGKGVWVKCGHQAVKEAMV